MRVLIADDDTISRMLLSKVLRGWGYEVDVCTDGEEAWDLLRQPDGPRLAIVDWDMPKLDGADLCRRLRQLPGDQYVYTYLLTSKTESEYVQAGLSAGADDYLSKPVVAAELRLRLRVGTRLVELHRELIEARESLREQATLDPLTGVWNRRAFQEVAEQNLRRSVRSAEATSLLMLDVDRFKSINDRFGHHVGDVVLREVAQRIRRSLRASDALGRFGGEEFIALLPDCDLASALEVGERVRQAVRSAPFRSEALELPVTISIGAAEHSAMVPDLNALVKAADEALYRAKREGRDLVRAA